MKILFASDIHGNAEKLSTLVKMCIDGRFDRFVITGDLTGFFGSGLGDIISPVRNITSVSVGNCDNEALLKTFKIPVFDDYGVIYADGVNIFYTHGHIFNENRLPPCMNPGDVLVSGHSHIPVLNKTRGRVFANPGSAAKPRGGFMPTFMVYENRKFEIFDFNGNVIVSLGI